MKRTNSIILGIVLIAGTLTTSCLKDNDVNYSLIYPNALVTVKPDADNSSFFLQLDDNTVLKPVNMVKSPFGTKEVRALTNYRKAKDSEKLADITVEQVYVNWLDSILTKPTAANLGAEENIAQYGNDPVEIVNDWVTIAEDGYLTLRFRTYWGGKTHIVNLVNDGDEENPYHVTFFHDANGDRYGRSGDGLVAFRLSDLPDTQGQTIDLTLEWNSFSGKKHTTFKYCTRAPTNTKSFDAEGEFEKSLL